MSKRARSMASLRISGNADADSENVDIFDIFESIAEVLFFKEAATCLGLSPVELGLMLTFIELSPVCAISIKCIEA